MSELLVPIELPGSPDVLGVLEEEAREYAARSRATNTIRAYRSDSTAFTSWCREHDLVALPAEPITVALYLTDSARTLKTSTLRRRLSSIAIAHQTAGVSSPVEDARVKAMWAGIRRTHGTAEHGKDPVLTADLRLMVAALPESLLGCRDACLLLLGFATALRRSELVGLNVDDLAETGDGLVVTVRRSKTDQEGEGREIGVPYGSDPSTCPLRCTRPHGSKRPASNPVRCSVRWIGTVDSVPPRSPTRPSRAS
jgi:integrase